MTETQQKTADFIERWKGRMDNDPMPSHSEDFGRELRELLQEVVEGCCEIECPLCSWGRPLIEKAKLDEHFYHHEDLMVLCESWKIRRHFAWLKGR